MTATRLQDYAQRLGTVYGTLLNTAGDLEAMGAALNSPPYHRPPVAPVLYVKTPNTVRIGGGAVEMPPGVDILQASPCLALVFSRRATRVKEADALDHIAGCVAAIDVCIPHQTVYRPPVKERCRDGFLPLGVELSPFGNGEVALDYSVNLEPPRRFSSVELLRQAPRLVAEVTAFMTLDEGDILLTGLASDGPVVRAGDEITVHLDGAATLRAHFVETAP